MYYRTLVGLPIKSQYAIAFWSSIVKKIHVCIVSFPRYNDSVVENLRFFAVFIQITTVLFTAIRYDMKGYESWSSPRATRRENHVILRSLVLTHYQRVSDGQMATMPMAKLR